MANKTTMIDNQNITPMSQDKIYPYVRRLIEVDLPIKIISEHARREKSIRHGHISTLHIWWARRPLASCRAIICASLWPDPADPQCPQEFRDQAAITIIKFAREAVSKQDLAKHCSPNIWSKWQIIAKKENTLDTTNPSHLNSLRFCLLDFIADFAKWENSTQKDYLEVSRVLTQAAHEALGGIPNTKPLVVDPFAGGGSIPLEALRIGADIFASDLNPVAVLLNKVIVEYIPKYGHELANQVYTWSKWIEEEAKKELVDYFPTENSSSPSVAYLWARTIHCQGPRCGVEVPLIRSLCLAKRGNKFVNLRLIPDAKNKVIELEIINNVSTSVTTGTVKRGSVTCPVCGYTTPSSSVREQLKVSLGGADTSRLLAVVHRSEHEKTYHLPSEHEIQAVKKARNIIKRDDVIPFVEIPLMSGVFNVPLYGINRWDLLFSARQLLVAKVITDKIEMAFQKMIESQLERNLAVAIKVVLLLARDKYLDFRSNLCTWINVGEKIGHTFGRQSLGMIFDWAEGVPFGDISGSWKRSVDYIAEFLCNEATANLLIGTVEKSPAQSHPLPDNSVQAFISDPPYYNAVPYADLSDFFYVWLQQDLHQEFPIIFSESTAPKDDELCEMKGWDTIRYSYKDASFYEKGMQKALSEARRLCVPSGVGVIVFAHKTTTGWETLLSALINAGWIVTGSWPIDTERSSRLRAMKSAALASSVHIVCRPRTSDSIGDWRDVLQELPQRIHEWMPRLASEGVVGADAIFACLGPALEIFSRYSSVEKASGELVTLKEYLEYVWAAVSKEALSMIFSNADTTSFEEDARLTAIWLWTLSTGSIDNNETNESETDDEDDDETSSKTTKTGGYTLEYDAARKIAQGLGAHLEQLTRLVEVKGSTARLLPVSERTKYLFGKEEAQTPSKTKGKKGKKKEPEQLNLFAVLGITETEEDTDWGEKNVPQLGNTTLDCIHQSMILFAAGRSEALKRFLVDEGAGKDQRFWGLAQALSALYPTGTEEKRWVDGVLARKKGLGFS